MACACSKPLEKFTIHTDSFGQSANSFQVFVNIPLKTVVKAEVLSVNLGSNVVTAVSNVAYVIIDELTSRYNDKTLPNVYISLNNESDPYKDLRTVDQRFIGLTSNMVQSNTIIYTQLLHGTEANVIIESSNVSMAGWSNIQTTNGLVVASNGSNLVLIGTPPDEYVNLDSGSNVVTFTETSNIYNVPQTGFESTVQSGIVTTTHPLTTSNISNMQRALLKLDLDQTSNGRTIFYVNNTHSNDTDYVYPIQQLEKLTISIYDERGIPITTDGPTYMTLRFHCARDNIYRY
jgi:hypothetical protein